MNGLPRIGQMNDAFMARYKEEQKHEEEVLKDLNARIAKEENAFLDNLVGKTITKAELTTLDDDEGEEIETLELTFTDKSKVFVGAHSPCDNATLDLHAK